MGVSTAAYDEHLHRLVARGHVPALELQHREVDVAARDRIAIKTDVVQPRQALPQPPNSEPLWLNSERQYARTRTRDRTPSGTNSGGTDTMMATTGSRRRQAAAPPAPARSLIGTRTTAVERRPTDRSPADQPCPAQRIRPSDSAHDDSWDRPRTLRSDRPRRLDSQSTCRTADRSFSVGAKHPARPDATLDSSLLTRSRSRSFKIRNPGRSCRSELERATGIDPRSYLGRQPVNMRSGASTSDDAHTNVHHKPHEHHRLPSFRAICDATSAA